MKKFSVVLGLLVMSCASQVSTVKPSHNSKPEVPTPNKVEIAPVPDSTKVENLSDVQLNCLNSGDNSFRSSKLWISQKYPQQCQDELFIRYLHLESVGAGHRDAERLVGVGELQCFAGTNELADDVIGGLMVIGKKIMSMAEAPTLDDDLVSHQSCLPIEAQKDVIKMGFSCGFYAGLAEETTRLKSIKLYMDAAEATGLLDKSSMQSSENTVIKANACYLRALEYIQEELSSEEVSSDIQI